MIMVAGFSWLVHRRRDAGIEEFFPIKMGDPRQEMRLAALECLRLAENFLCLRLPWAGRSGRLGPCMKIFP
jgi:hypothetical protein